MQHQIIQIMQTQFKLLFTVNLNHDFFQSGKLQRVSITPSLETATILKQIGGRFFQKREVFSVYYDTSKSHFLTEEFLSDWEFSLKPEDPYFYHFTDLPINSRSFLFTDSDQNNELVLTEEDSESEEREPGIIIKLSPPIPSENSEGPAYTLSFSTRKTTWRYFIINHSGQSGTFGIKAEKNTFTGLGLTEIPEGQKAQLFQSDSLIVLSEVPNQEIGLWLNEEENIVVKELPIPQNYQIQPDKNHGFFSDMYIYV